MEEVPVLDGMCYAIRKEVITHIGQIPLNINKSGWIQEVLMGMYAQKHNKKLLKDTSILAFHPPNRGYNHQQATIEEKDYLKAFDITEEYFAFKKIARQNLSINKTKRNIIFLWHEESLTGATSVIYEITKWITYHHIKLYNFYVFTLRKSYPKFHDELSTNYIGNVPGKNLSEKVQYIISKLNPEVVYGNTIDVANITKMFKSKNVKTILHCHEKEDGFDNFQRNVAKIPLKEYMPEVANIFISVCSGTTKLLQSYGVQRIEEIPSFINENNILISSKQPHNLPEKTKKRIIGCGTGILRKGFDRFIEIAMVELGS